VVKRHYDTLIVGAGSAGSVLASRLSEDSSRSVCVVEAGPDYTSVDQLPPRVRGFTVSPRLYAGGPRLASHEWQYIARATDRFPEMVVPRGKVIGGSSSINGTVFLRALRSDLDGWATAGNPDWAYAQCVPYYRKLEVDHDFASDDWHGASGPIHVSRAARENWLPPSQAFFEACTGLGAAACLDMNRADARGVGPIPTNFYQGLRYSSAVGYLIPARHRPNLSVLGDTLVTRVLLDGRSARGIEVLSESGVEAIEADEVILSAGAIASPHLLMLSGIGPASALSAAGVEPVLDLPGVGQHVRDHPFVATFWDTFQAGATDRLTGLPWQLQIRTTAGQADDGWLTMIMSTARSADGGFGFTIPSSLMYARSTGTLTLQSPDPRIAPLLDFNYLSDPADLDHLRTLARLAIEIGNDPAFDSIRAGLRQPKGEELASDASFDDWITRTISTGHHISCTARMGPSGDGLAVVDQRGRVYGVDNLRVIDASIMPDCPSVNLNATVMMMAEKLANTFY